jgi:hypothetical protein
LLEPKKNDLSVLATDKGPVILPKLYRRYTNWSARNKANITSQNFQNFLAAGSKAPSALIGPDNKPITHF